MDSRYSIEDVTRLLMLPLDTGKTQVYTDCPYCGGRKKLNINFRKNVFRCNKCGDRKKHTQGGPLDLAMLYLGLDSPKAAAWELRKRSGDVVPTERKVLSFPEEKLAPIDVRDKTYSLLLSHLGLRDRHRKSLRERGLTDSQIDEFGYRSCPKNVDALAKKLLFDGATLDGVPGFYTENGNWSMVRTGSGILIPQRNSRNQIQGFQIRLDDVSSGAKYIALSSRDKPDGTGSRAFIHFRSGARGCDTVVLTEGALKADVISALSGYSVLSVPGVNSLSLLPSALNSLLRQGMREIKIAYDMDAYENEHVLAAREKLVDMLCSMEITHSTLRWDSSFKGLDDYLSAQRR